MMLADVLTETRAVRAGFTRPVRHLGAQPVDETRITLMDVGLRQTRGEDVESGLAERSVSFTLRRPSRANFMLRFLSQRSVRLKQTPAASRMYKFYAARTTVSDRSSGDLQN